MDTGHGEPFVPQKDTALGLNTNHVTWNQSLYCNSRGSPIFDIFRASIIIRPIWPNGMSFVVDSMRNVNFEDNLLDMVMMVSICPNNNAKWSCTFRISSNRIFQHAWVFQSLLKIEMEAIIKRQSKLISQASSAF
ncbi:hypothetical protein CEXT_642331 [Caerostris extrusa]|uniref:Uncharacterized protein n=1 Tax=Caerostris extrusa TaxID=172846 RepID=A0AAV4V7F2_CAEEX|nr:hypothetical protein CEXT_642331 [Caerostris extrusa]